MAETTTPTLDTQPEDLRIGDRDVDLGLFRRLEGRVDAEGDGTVTVTNPYTGRALGHVPRGTPDDIRTAIARAREAQGPWARRSIADRARIFMRFHDHVIESRDEILDLVQLENGKARRSAFEEVMDTAITARYYANTAADVLAPRRRQGALPGLTVTREFHHPFGVVGIIAPWNYPLTLGIGDALPALLAGNAVVIKPDAQTPYSALWAADALERCGLPPGLVQIVTGEGSKLGTPLIEGTDFIMFTGSTRVGRKIAGQAGEQLKGCSMELGGKNAMLVLDDADLDRAVPGAINAAFSNSGQLCISMERLFVHESIADDFVDRFAARTKAAQLGATLDFTPEIGSLISDKQLATVCEHVDDAVDKGATLLAGGRPRPDLGPLFYEPTILDGVADEMTLCREETFGPVISIYRFSSVEEVVARANDSDYGLNFSIWSRDTASAAQLATRLQAGTVNVNEGYAAAWASVDAQMGGFKASGIGRRHGAHGIEKYTEPQTVSVQRLMPVMLHGPQKRRYDVLANALRSMRYLPWVK